MNSQQFSHLSERSGMISKSSIFCCAVIDPGSSYVGIGGGGCGGDDDEIVRSVQSLSFG